MQCPKNELEHKQMETIPYTSIVGSLIHAQTCIRPDISFIVGMHSDTCKEQDYMLAYRKYDNLEVIRYTYSNFVDVSMYENPHLATRKSIFGYLFLLTEGKISWKSAKQPIIIVSTMEVEFVAFFKATVQANLL